MTLPVTTPNYLPDTKLWRVSPDQEIFTKRWISALRSGLYTQGKEALRVYENDNNYQYCCLGVACEILNGVKWVTKNGGTVSYGAELSSGDLGEDLMEAVGLDSREMSHLVKMNDQQGATFEEIADWIEGNVIG